MSKVAELKADMVPAAVPTPPIPDNLGRKIPNLHCHIQPIMPLVFDDSMTFYECLAKCTAYVNAIGEQINRLTDATKEFLEYMVKWGEELDAQWVQYQADLNKAWANYQAVINGQITDLENRWQSYQTDLNQQWQTFKSQYLNEWNQYKTDFQQEWQDFKDSIESTIEGQVDAWLVNNIELIASKIQGWEILNTDTFIVRCSDPNAKVRWQGQRFYFNRQSKVLWITCSYYGEIASIVPNTTYSLVATITNDLPFNIPLNSRLYQTAFDFVSTDQSSENFSIKTNTNIFIGRASDGIFSITSTFSHNVPIHYRQEVILNTFVYVG